MAVIKFPFEQCVYKLAVHSSRELHQACVLMIAQTGCIS